MGSSNSNIASDKRNIREVIAQKFDKFDFRINNDDEFTFFDRAKREITGCFQSDEFMLRLFKGFRKFMIKTACSLYGTEKGVDGNYIGPYTAPPLIDEIWCLAILYSTKYKELCNLLVGGYIDRLPSQNLKGIKLFKFIWPDYDKNFWELDSKYTVWILDKNIYSQLLSIYNYVISTKTSTNKINILNERLDQELKIFHHNLTFKKSCVNLNRPQERIPEWHEYYNTEVRDNPKEVYHEIYEQLPLNLDVTMERKYCTGDQSPYYIQEYAKFLTMLYFTNKALTPSEEVDQVWHCHQSMTIEYRDFCDNVFGKFIHHAPTVGGNSDSINHNKLYCRTIEFYRFLFNESPPIGLWPPATDRFNPENFIGSWYSLLRIFQSVARVIDMHKFNQPSDVTSEIMNCYFSWEGKYIFSRDYKIKMTKPTKLREGCTKLSYWYAGGCSIIKE